MRSFSGDRASRAYTPFVLLVKLYRLLGSTEFTNLPFTVSRHLWYADVIPDDELAGLSFPRL